MLKVLVMFMVVAALALVPAVGSAQGFSVKVMDAELTVSMAGDAEVAFEDGVLTELDVEGREYSGGAYVSFGGMDPVWADVMATSNFTFTEMGDMPHSFLIDHDGTIDFTVGTDTLSLEYEGMGKAGHMMHTFVTKSGGDFKVTDGTGMFEDFKGVEGTYYVKFVDHGKMVGSMAGFSFSAMEAAEEEDVEVDNSGQGNAEDAAEDAAEEAMEAAEEAAEAAEEAAEEAMEAAEEAAEEEEVEEDNSGPGSVGYVLEP